ILRGRQKIPREGRRILSALRSVANSRRGHRRRFGRGISPTANSSSRRPRRLKYLFRALEKSTLRNPSPRRCSPDFEDRRQICFHRQNGRLKCPRFQPKCQGVRHGCATRQLLEETHFHRLKTVWLSNFFARHRACSWLRRRPLLRRAGRRWRWASRISRKSWFESSSGLPVALAQFLLDKACKPCTSPGSPKYFAE